MKRKTNAVRTGIILLLILIFTVISHLKKEGTQDQSGYDSDLIRQAYINKRSNIQIGGDGVIVKVLKDDLKGSKHQRFIVKVSDKNTVLIAHNIDLAPRVENPQKGGQISFYGEYEWNNKGGVIHWTHHDPAKRHPDGWLRYEGKIYQ